MHQSGIENVVALRARHWHPDKSGWFIVFTNNMTVLYDGDAAGIKASIRGIDMLLEEGMKRQSHLLPDGDDRTPLHANTMRRVPGLHTREWNGLYPLKNQSVAGRCREKTPSSVPSLSETLLPEHFHIIPKPLCVMSIYQSALNYCVEDKLLLVSEVAKRREKQAEQQASEQNASVGQPIPQEQCRSRCQWPVMLQLQPGRHFALRLSGSDHCLPVSAETPPPFPPEERICILHPTRRQEEARSSIIRTTYSEDGSALVSRWCAMCPMKGWNPLSL